MAKGKGTYTMRGGKMIFVPDRPVKKMPIKTVTDAQAPSRVQASRGTSRADRKRILQEANTRTAKAIAKSDARGPTPDFPKPKRTVRDVQKEQRKIVKPIRYINPDPGEDKSLFTHAKDLLKKNKDAKARTKQRKKLRE